MAQYTENITFSNIINPSSAFGGDGPRATYTKDSDRAFTSNYLESRNTTDTDKIGELFTTNAIDIHWGGAQMPSSNISSRDTDTINTTGQLLNYIKTLRTNIATLNNTVSDLSSTVSTLSTDVNDLKMAFATIASNVGTLIAITNGETTNS